ncbi:unnamed protein product [Caenorhabditis angaria]|uniref:Uncharacterized protein n=1 Tax=Caenorhabditis angaria TaxID=860376 RepID=A0A9P1IDI4_9PELO|nr:unnamed protein product [Caenorhabditis angaria]
MLGLKRILFHIRIQNDAKVVLRNSANLTKKKEISPKLNIPYKLATITTVVSHNCTEDHSINDVSECNRSVVFDLFKGVAK